MIKPMELIENTDDKLQLNEAAEDSNWVSDMYGAVDDQEKNINRVLGGLKRSSMMGSPMMPGMGGQVSPRYVEALETKIRIMDQQLRKLTNQNNRLAQSQNKIIDRINELSRKFN